MIPSVFELRRIEISTEVGSAFVCNDVVFSTITNQPKEIFTLQVAHSTRNCVFCFIGFIPQKTDVKPNIFWSYYYFLTVGSADICKKLKNGVIEFIHPRHPRSHERLFSQSTKSHLVASLPNSLPPCIREYSHSIKCSRQYGYHNGYRACSEEEKFSGLARRRRARWSSYDHVA